MSLSALFTGIGVAPKVAFASGVGPTLVRVVFNEGMSDNSALNAPANYVLTPDVGSDARSVVSVTPQGVANPAYVDLGLSGPLTPGTNNYQVAVSASLTDAASNPMDAGFLTADFSGPSSTGAGLTHVLDHADQAENNLLEQFQDKEKIVALTRVYAGQIQDLEDAIFTIITETPLYAAIGAQLDGWGRILNQPRNGQTDDVYRTFLIAKTLIMRSTGTVENVLEAIDVLTGGDQLLTMTEPPDEDPAHFHVLITPALPVSVDGFVASTLALRAKAAGVRGIITFFDTDGIAFDNVLEGFDDADDAFGGSVGA